MDETRHVIMRLAALQQPKWEDQSLLDEVRRRFRLGPGLVRSDDVFSLRDQLQLVAEGKALIIQAGDCAESLDDQDPATVGRKATLLDFLAASIQLVSQMPVLRVGRIAGQFTKPRSEQMERVNGEELPVYRGDMVNGIEATASSRRHDPGRLALGYDASQSILRHLGWDGPSPRFRLQSPVWASHEMLLLDYETSLLRQDHHGRMYLSSTHWPWVGERTRQIDGAHVALLSHVANPVACKIGPNATEGEVLGICRILDPRRQPGRLTLIVRMGAARVRDHLPSLVRAVRTAGHPVIWVCDPMHGNTVKLPCGRKTRFVDAIVEEAIGFCDAVRAGGAAPGGLHLETTPDDVAECLGSETEIDNISGRYTSLCDPRLTPQQALSVVTAWARKATETPSPQLFSGEFRHGYPSNQPVSPSYT